MKSTTPEIRIFCEGLLPIDNSHEDLFLNAWSNEESKNNIQAPLSSFAKSIIRKDDFAFDLLRIAIYVYIADSLVNRVNSGESFNQAWNKILHFHIPVFQPDTFNDPKIKDFLCKILHFAVGHKYTFTFYKWESADSQIFLNEVFNVNAENLDVDCISMFSGGIDSLASFLELSEQGRKPLLVSHYSNSKLAKYRERLAEELEKEVTTSINRFEIPVSLKRVMSQSSTQRSRSFLYACFGLAFAKCLNLTEIFFSDNGIVSFNLKTSSQNVGTLNTRSTNPEFISSLNKLSELIWSNSPSTPTIQNLLLWKTKADIVLDIKKRNKASLLSLTTSCVKTREISNGQPFCGVCSQCIDRRIAVEYAQINNNDEPREKYETNIFIDNLQRDSKTQIGLTHGENLFRWIQHINNADIDDFIKINSEVIDYCPVNYNVEEFVEQTLKLHKAYSHQVVHVLKEASKDVLLQKCHENSLIATLFRENTQLGKRNHEFKLPSSKKLRIYKASMKVIFLEQELEMTSTEFDFLSKLAKEPKEFCSYNKLTSNSTDLNYFAGNATNAQTIIKQINIKFREVIKSQKANFSSNFSVTKNKSGFGYRICDELCLETELLE